MSMNINSNYSQFYRGTEQIKTYGAIQRVYGNVYRF